MIILVVILIALVVSLIPLVNLYSVKNVAFSELISNPQKYNGKHVCTEGVYLSSFEVSVLGAEISGQGINMQLVEPTIWIESREGIKFKSDCLEIRELYGTAEFCNAKVCGIFEYGERYGHIGRYDYQIR